MFNFLICWCLVGYCIFKIKKCFEQGADFSNILSMGFSVLGFFAFLAYLIK
jgi:hypothetical protein